MQTTETHQGVIAIGIPDSGDTQEKSSRQLLAAMADHLGADALDAAAMQVQRWQANTEHYRAERDLVWRLSDRLDKAKAELSNYEQVKLPAARQYPAHQALIASLRDDVAALEQELRGHVPRLRRLPDGKYLVEIIDTLILPAQAPSSGTVAVFHYAVLQGTELGRRFARHIHLQCSNSDIKQQSEREIRDIKAACGIYAPVTDASIFKLRPHWLEMRHGAVVCQGVMAAAGAVHE